MLLGMIWSDNDPKRNITEKIELAIQFYCQKFGNEPTLCFLHPNYKEISLTNDLAVKIEFNQGLPPDHIWVGVK